MKKTILATSLALGLGVTGVVASQDAEASSYDINKEELAYSAQNNPSVLNASALHEGEYDYNFNHKDVEYNFESDGTNYSWAYNGGNNAQPAVQKEEAAPAVKEETQNVQYNNYTEEVQQPAQNTQAAPAVQETEQAQTTQPAASTPAQTQQSTGGSTKAQFLAAGGTDAMWSSIVLPESSGNPNAVSPNGYQGLGQTKESWGTGSVSEQTSGMLNYAQERYGSIDAAIQFREANNWW